SLHHRGVFRLAAAGAPGGDLDPRLDAAAGSQLGQAASRGVRGGGAGRAAFLVDREVRLPRAAAVRGDPGRAARLAPVEAAVAPDRAAAVAGFAGLNTGCIRLAGRTVAPARRVSPARTATAPPAAPPTPARQAAATAGAWHAPAREARRAAHRRWRPRPLRPSAAAASALRPRSGAGRRTRSGRRMRAGHHAPVLR